MQTDLCPRTPVGKKLQEIIQGAGVPKWLAECFAWHAEKYSEAFEFFVIVKVREGSDCEWFGVNNLAAVGPALASGRPAVVRLAIALHELREAVQAEALGSGDEIEGAE